jgi:hypothetical protein
MSRMQPDIQEEVGMVSCSGSHIQLKVGGYEVQVDVYSENSSSLDIQWEATKDDPPRPVKEWWGNN